MQTDRSQHPALQMLRQDIISCFSDIACFLLPHPGLIATTSEHFIGQLAGLYSYSTTSATIFTAQELERVKKFVNGFQITLTHNVISRLRGQRSKVKVTLNNGVAVLFSAWFLQLL